MDVGIVSVPMFGTDPVELGSEIPLRLIDEVARKGLQVGKLVRILGRDNETEMMAIAVAAVSESSVIGVVLLGVKHVTRSAVLRDALAA